MNKKFSILLFSLILFVAGFLRFYQLSNLPPSLNWDEVSIGYNAYSVFKTGRDEWGKFLPLSFRAFGDYKLPFYIYLDVLFVGIFGLNEVAVRLPSALAGIGIVILTFFILKELTKNISLSLWGMFVSAIIPWFVILSRIALEANVALFLTMVSFFLFLKSQKIKWLLPLSAAFLGLSAFSYNSSRVLILPFLLLITFFWFRFLKKKETLTSFVILIIFLGSIFFQALNVDSKARYRWTTILDEGAIESINQLRGSSNLPPQVNRLVYNKVTYFIFEASKNYFSHFNPSFLFWNGGSNLQFSVPGIGQLYLMLAPLILLGIWQMIRERKNWQLFILGWLIIAPIPGAITRDAPHALRTIFLSVPLVFTAVMGIKGVKDLIPPRFFSLIAISLSLVLIGETYLFWQTYTGDYRNNYSWVWQFGYKQVLEFVKTNQAQYDRIIFTKKYGEPHEFVLFYLKYEPLKYQTDKNLVRYEQSDWFWVDRFDKFEFINDWEIKEKVLGLKNSLLITTPNNYPINSQVLKEINFLDGKPAFEILEVK